MSSNNNELLIGVLVGAVLVGGATAFLSSRTGRALRRDVVGACQDMSEKLEDTFETISEKANGLKKDLAEGAEDWGKKASKKAKRTVNNIVREMDSLGNKPPHIDLKIGLLIGSLLAGGLTIGLSTWLKGRNPPKEGMAHKMECYLNEIRKVVGNLATAMDDTRHEFQDEVINGAPSDALHNVVDFAMSGVKLWKNLKKGA